MQLQSASRRTPPKEASMAQTDREHLANAPTAPASHRPDDRVLSETPATSRRAADAPLARFYMTGDLRAATGLSRTHLDYYLREGVILPTARTESGYLLFDDSEVAVAHQVIAWRQQGTSIRDIRKRLHREPDDA
jgi:hypothetical protein